MIKTIKTSVLLLTLLANAFLHARDDIPLAAFTLDDPIDINTRNNSNAELFVFKNTLDNDVHFLIDWGWGITDKACTNNSIGVEAKRKKMFTSTGQKAPNIKDITVGDCYLTGIQAEITTPSGKYRTPYLSIARKNKPNRGGTWTVKFQNGGYILTSE